MKRWLTAADLAGLPGMPVADRVIRRWGDDGRLTRRRRTGGKGWEYLVSSLPEATQAALAARAQTRALAAVTPATAPAIPDEFQEPTVLADWQRDTARARLGVLALADQWRHARGGSTRAVFDALSKAAADGALPADAQALIACAHGRAGKRSAPSPATLYRWQSAADAARAAGRDVLAALAPQSTVPAEPLPAWLAPLMREYQKPSKPTVAYAYRTYTERLAGPERARMPSLRTVQRTIEALPVELREYGRLGPSAMRAVQPFVRRTTDGLWPMDVVTVDGHSAKCYVLRADSGRRCRPEVTTYLDLATRRIVGYSVWWAESQTAIWMAMRQMVLDPRRGMHGQPAGVAAIQYSDNGAYRGHEHLSVLARLGTQPMFSLPYRAQSRGAIERLNSSVWVPLAKTQPTYCGDDADPEKFKRSLKAADVDGTGILTWGLWLAECERAIADYNSRPHAALKRGREKLSPDRAWQIAIDDGWQPTLLTTDDLHDLLPAVMRGAVPARQVRRGEVSTPWGRYADDALRHWHGRDVRVHYDPMDGSRVWVCEPGGRLICVAERDRNARDYIPQSQVDHAREQREQTRVARREREIATIRAEETPLLDGETYDLPDLVLSAQDWLLPARESRQAAAPAQAPAAQVADLPTPAADAYLDRLDTDQARYEAWRVLRDRDARGDLLSPREGAFLEAFGASGYCRAMQAMWAEFDAATGAAV